MNTWWHSLRGATTLAALVLLIAGISLPGCSNGSASPPVATIEITPAPFVTPAPLTTSTATLTTAPSRTPPTQATLSGFQQLWMVDPTQGWVVTRDHVLHTSDGGISWTDVSPPGVAPSSGLDFTFTGGFFPDAQEGWVVGSGQSPATVFRTHDGGQHWTALSLGPAAIGPALATSSFPDPLHGWILLKQGAAMGSEAAALYGTTDGGAHWNLLVNPSGNHLSDHGLSFGGDKTGVTFRDQATGWVTGIAGAGIWLYMTHDGGHSWQPQAVPIPQGFPPDNLFTYPPRLFGSSVGILPIQADSSAVMFYASHDGGQSWEAMTPVQFPAEGGSPLADYFLDAGHGWVTDGVTLYRTDDGGRTWTKLTPNLSLPQAVQLDFVTPEIGWAVISGPSGSEPQLLKTTDGGATWLRLNATVSR